MKWHNRLAGMFGYDLIRKERNQTIYERALCNILASYSVDLVLDVGGNLGQFALGLRQYGYKGKIITFEPVASCYDHLMEISKKDELWTVEKLALGQQKETKVIQVPKSTVFSSLLQANSYSLKKYHDHLQDFKQESIDIDTLENYFREKNLALSQRTFLKIDTQGYDMNVLLGAKNLIPNFVGLSTELSFISLYESAPKYTEVLNFIDSQNFSIANLFPVIFDEKKRLLIEADCVALNQKFVHIDS